jgi:threonine/homoserine/homoserine lactone efflux protein
VSSATLLAFAGVALLCVATPGPTTLLALSNGSRFGLRAALPGMAGAVASDFLLIAAAAAGLSALLAASASAFAVVKWVGVAYLAYLGGRLLQAPAAPRSLAPGCPPSSFAMFLRSFLVAATNPKAYLFFAALLPQFVDAAQPQMAQYAVLAVIFGTLDLVTMIGYAMAGERATRVFDAASTRIRIDRACGALLLLLAIGLTLLRRPPAAT